MSLLDTLLGRPERIGPASCALASDLTNVVHLTDGVYDLLYNRSYPERCQRDGHLACIAWLHEQIDELGVARIHHERLVILAKFRNGDRSHRDLPKS